MHTYIQNKIYKMVYVLHLYIIVVTAFLFLFFFYWSYLFQNIKNLNRFKIFHGLTCFIFYHVFKHQVCFCIICHRHLFRFTCKIKVLLDKWVQTNSESVSVIVTFGCNVCNFEDFLRCYLSHLLGMCTGKNRQ